MSKKEKLAPPRAAFAAKLVKVLDDLVQRLGLKGYLFATMPSARVARSKRLRKLTGPTDFLLHIALSGGMPRKETDLFLHCSSPDMKVLARNQRELTRLRTRVIRAWKQSGLPTGKLFVFAHPETESESAHQ